MYRYLKFEIKPFPVVIHVYIGNDGEIIKDVKTKFNNYDLLENMPSNVAGICASDDILEGHCIIYVMNTRYLLHESVHCIDDIMKRFEIESDEFRAYNIDYLYGHLKDMNNYKIFNKKKE